MSKTIIPVPDSEISNATPDISRESFRITAAADATVVELFDDVFSWEAKRLLGEIRDCKSKSLEMRINSMGGDVFGGVAIYNALARFPGKVIVQVEGIAASIASIIAMAGDEIRMGKGTYMMIHEPHSMSYGTVADMERTAALLAKVRDSIADIYAERTGIKKEDVLSLMADETWYTADEAVKAGFADSVFGQAAMAARLEPGRFLNAPAEIVARATAIGPDEIKAAVGSIVDEKILRGIASNIGNRIKQLGSPASAAAPKASSDADPPEAPPASAADSQMAETPAEPIASDLELEAAQELLGRVLKRDQP